MQSRLVEPGNFYYFIASAEGEGEGAEVLLKSPTVQVLESFIHFLWSVSY